MLGLDAAEEQRVLLSIVAILVLALSQLLYTRSRQQRRNVSSTTETVAPPEIRTFSSERISGLDLDPATKKGKARFKREKADISSWVTDLAGTEPDVVEEDAARIRQRMVDRVLATGSVDDQELQDATFKVDVVRSIRELDDEQVLAWWTDNKDLLETDDDIYDGLIDG